MLMYPLYEHEIRMIADFLRPLAEEWSGVARLEMTAVYGIRRYLQGGRVGAHVDTPGKEKAFSNLSTVYLRV